MWISAEHLMTLENELHQDRGSSWVVTDFVWKKLRKGIWIIK